MKTKLLLALVAFVVVAVAPAYAQVDAGDPDSVILLTTRPEAGADDSTFACEVYVFNDQNTLSGISMGFGWENDNLALDSAIVTQTGFDAFGANWIIYPNNSLDSANSKKAFSCVGFWFLNGSFLQPTPDRKHLATYYFTLSSWDAADQIVLDTFQYIDGV